MKQDKRNGRKAAGFTLITALAFTLVVGTVLAGVGTVAVSHLERSTVEADYANAVSLADAGINHEIAWISADITDGTRAHQKNSPYTGAVSGVPGSYSVFVIPYGTDCNGTGNWSAPADMCVEATGTVNGISRTVRVRGKNMSVFGEYAIYAYKDSTFNGTGNSQKDIVVGNMGSNADATFHGVLGSDAVQGILSLNGAGLTTNSDKGNVHYNPDPVMFPTITQIANAAFPSGGLSWLATHNSNANIKILPPSDPTLASEPTVAGFTLSDVNTKLASAGYTTATRSLSSSPVSVTKDTSTLDVSTSSTPRFAMAATSYSNAVDAKNTKVIFFPPGDYYLSDLNINADTCIFLTHLGQVRIWVDSSTGSTDDISKNYFIFTDPTPSKFRLYYNKCGTIKMRGHAYFHGGIYGIKDGCTNSPELNEAGGDAVFGSVIMNVFTISGGSKVIFPNNGGTDDSDFSLRYGFKDSWKEILNPNAPNGTSVFVDGSSN